MTGLHPLVQNEVNFLDAIRTRVAGIDWLGGRVFVDRMDAITLAEMPCLNIVTTQVNQDLNSDRQRLAFLISAQFTAGTDLRDRLDSAGFCASPLLERIYQFKSDILNALENINLGGCGLASIITEAHEIRDKETATPYAVIRIFVRSEFKQSHLKKR